MSNAVTLCVVNFNGAHYMSQVVEGIRTVQNSVDEVLFVDCASTDRSLELARRELPEAAVIALVENRGPGPARNAGCERAANDRILFIDNDVLLSPDCPRLLAAALDQHPAAVAAMPAVLYARDPDRVQFDGASPHFLGLMSLEHADVSVGDVPPTVREIDSLITACFMMDRTRWGKAPPFDEAMFLYLEDHEFGLRARLLGHRLLSVPAARCFHGEGSSDVSLRATGRYTELRVSQLMANRWRLLLKLYETRTLLVASPALLLFDLFQAIGAVAKGWFPQWKTAVSSVLRQRPDIARRRREFQNARQVPDAAVLRGGPIPFTKTLLDTKIQRLGGSVLNLTTDRYWKLIGRYL